MKLKYKFSIFLSLIFLTLISCEKSENKMESKENPATKQETASCECLEKYDTDPTFFNEEFVSEFAKTNPAKVEKNGKGNYIYYTASWEKDSQPYFLSIESLTHLDNLKKQYEYVFKNKDLTLVEYVQKTYANKTDEEIEKSKALLNEQYEKQNPELDENQEQVKNEMQDTFLDMEKNAYTEIPDLGDYAVYNSKTNDLYVVCRNVFFQIRGQVGPWGKNDRQKGVELAVNASRKMINLCL